MTRSQKKLQERLRQKDELYEGSRGWYSKAYHKHFESYAEYMVVDEKGHKKIERVYIGNWYVMALEDRTRKLLWLEFALCWLAALGLFLLCGTLNIQVNRMWYMAVCQAASIVGLVWSGSGIIHFIVLPEKSTISQYRKSFKAAQKGSIISMAAFCLSAGAVLLTLGLGCGDIGLHLLCLPLYALAVLIMLVINRLNANIPFEQLENHNPVREDAAIVD